jgi:hypothetical protein
VPRSFSPLLRPKSQITRIRRLVLGPRRDVLEPVSESGLVDNFFVRVWKPFSRDGVPDRVRLSHPALALVVDLLQKTCLGQESLQRFFGARFADGFASAEAALLIPI